MEFIKASASMVTRLNDRQMEAVKAPEGPVLVLAGAGSGKTAVLIRRIGYLISEKKCPSSGILAITFTNKAAREMRERVERLTESTIHFPWIGTIHSMCVKMLRSFVDRLGFDRNFVIYDADEQKILMRDSMKELNIDSDMFPPGTVISQISRAKDELIDCKAFREMNAGDYRMSVIASLYERYQEKLRGNNAMDFDDLIFHAVGMLRSYPDIREYYHGLFRHILIDEYQDTNTAQNVLAGILAERHRNIFVVGDDDQSIYGWRGANIRNILEFESQYPGCRVIRLEQNYRSTGCILDAANHVISQNVGRKGKTLWTEKERGEDIVFYKAHNEHNEALFVASEIKKLHETTETYRSFAVLYRINAQSRALERVFRERGIPYRIFGNISFYERKEIKDILAYMKFILNRNDNLMFKRIINEPRRGIGKSTVERLEQHAIQQNKSMFQVAMESGEPEDLKLAAAKLRTFTGMILRLVAYKDTQPLDVFYDRLLEETGILTTYQNERTPEAQARIENIRELKSSIMTHKEEFYEREGRELTLEDYLEDITLESVISEEETEDYVSVMTLHSAKGLEFPTVFITGMEEGVFPGIQPMESEGKMEEERRLCYVGITRAREQLYLLNATERTLFGKTTFNSDSRFLGEIPVRLITDFSPKSQLFPFRRDQRGFHVRRGEKMIFPSEISCTGEPEVEVVVGQAVEHKKFGKGVVVAIMEEGRDRMITIDFAMSGKKTLMAAYARLNVLKQKD